MNKIKRFFPRDAEKNIKKWLGRNYIVAVLGARQVGKTTLLQKIVQKPLDDSSGEQPLPYFYYSFDDVLLRGRVASDFYFLKKDLEARLGQTLENLKEPILLVIDEAQKEPSVFELLKIFHDQFAGKIKIIISGSASLEIQKKSSESLAGRAQYVYLYPLSLGEFIKEKFRIEERPLFQFLFEEKLTLSFLNHRQADLYPYFDPLQALLKEILVFGLLPGTWQRDKEERMGYLRSVVTLYLEKDIRMGGLVKELENFQNFLEILSFQVGGVLNLTKLSSSVQVSANTLRSYRSLLKNTFVLNSLPPYIRSPQERFVKSPKIYFYDVGVANYLAGRDRIENVLDSKASGGIFENTIVKSFEAFARNQTLPVRSFFWRDYQGREIDLILQKGKKIIPVEITNSQTVSNRKIANLSLFLKAQKGADFGLVVCNGELKKLKAGGKTVYCIPWWLWW